jgi:hypothetical protein
MITLRMVAGEEQTFKKAVHTRGDGPREAQVVPLVLGNFDVTATL